MTRALRLTCASALGVLAGASGLIFAAARSDFTGRGCRTIPRAEWEATANCAAGLALMASAVLLWQRKVTA